MRTRRYRSSGSPVPSLPVAAQRQTHRSVLLHEVIEHLAIRKDDVAVDATLGGAGHAAAIAAQLGSEGTFIGFDLDAEAIERTHRRLTSVPCHIHLIEANFRSIERELTARGIPQITKALFDLGWSSYQLDSGRGFSFLADEPLAMTYAGSTAGLTAERIVNTWGENSLADVIYGWGEERYSRRIARAIVERRQKKPFVTSRELAETIASSVPRAYAHGRIHPATRTFQALRIAVNDELGALEEGLRTAWHMLATGGRIAVVSFHSIEDRIVKHIFAEWQKEGSAERLTKKPITASEEEIQENPRARSAKLRVIQKISQSYESPHSKDKQIRPVDISGEA
jgi:16S rRNA (cytosine1402-N4)-methyltransferase